VSIDSFDAAEVRTAVAAGAELVLSVNGRAPTGSPLWLDTFDVQPGEVWEVALRADNPGIWMDHCHNLEHATSGMMFHLAYSRVSTPFTHGLPPVLRNVIVMASLVAPGASSGTVLCVIHRL